MQFGDPTNFWWLVAVPAVALFLIWAYRTRRRALERFAILPDRLTASVNRAARRWKAALLVAGILFGALALAQPRWGFEWREVKRKGVDVFVLLDVSKSMLTEDVRPNRLAQAKYACEDLVNKLQGDRVGLIAFAGTAFVQCPLTVDYEAFRLTLKDANPGIIQRGGSAIGAAIRTALKGFEAGEGRDRAIVLITDGEETESDALEAADEAAKAGVHIYAIGVGTAEGELIPVREDGKPMEFLKDSEGKVVKSRLDEQTLRELALKTQGIYVRSAAGDFGMDTIYEKGIGQLQRKEAEAKLQKRYFERFQWPLGIGFALLVLEAFVSDREEVMISLVLAAAISWPVRYNDGVTAYHSNDFSSAAATFEQATASPDRALQQRALYNLGNTAYRLGEADPTKAQPLWERAIKSYETALALDPKDEDAKFNHEFVKKKLEELKQQQQEQQQQEQQKKEQEKKQQSTGGEARQSQPDQQSNQPSQQEQQKHQQPRRGSESKEQKAQEPKSQPSEQKPPPQEQEPQASQAGNVDKQQAKALLDNLREDERNWNFFPEVQMKDLKDAGEPAKDW